MYQFNLKDLFVSLAPLKELGQWLVVTSDMEKTKRITAHKRISRAEALRVLNDLKFQTANFGKCASSPHDLYNCSVGFGLWEQGACKR